MLSKPKQYWKAKGFGKIIFILIYYSISFLFFYSYMIRVGMSLSDWSTAILMFFPFLAPALFLPPYWILRKKVPKEIFIENDTLFFTIKNKIILEIPISNVEVGLVKHSGYSVLIIYKRFLNSRGLWISKRRFTLVGLFVSWSWNANQIEEIHSSLVELGIAQNNSYDRGDLLGYLFEKR